MRQQFTANITRRAMQEQCHWAAKIVKVEGGYLAFALLADYATWRKQR